MASSLNANQIALQLTNNQCVPIINLHNNPARDKTIDLPAGTPCGTSAVEQDGKPFPAWRGIIPGVPPTKKPGLLGRALKREQSFDSFYFDQMNRGVSVDDFRKIGLSSTPSGSREHLATAGVLWDGSAGGGGVAAEPRTGGGGLMSRVPRMMSKIGPKSKMLKKQQSMFAFFPEHGPPLAGSMSSLVRAQCPFTGGGAVIKEAPAATYYTTEKKRSIPEQLLLKKGLSSRSQSLEENPEETEAESDSGGHMGSAPKPSSLATSSSRLCQVTERPSDSK